MRSLTFPTLPPDDAEAQSQHPELGRLRNGGEADDFKVSSVIGPKTELKIHIPSGIVREIAKLSVATYYDTVNQHLEPSVR
jgi:hypothetical protein